MIAVAAGIVLIPGTPARPAHHRGAGAGRGAAAVSASVFLLLLCNDPEVLGPWTNSRWLNILASVIIGVLLVLSGTLVVTTLFPSVSSAAVAIWLAIGLAGRGGRDRRLALAHPVPPPARRCRTAQPTMSRAERAQLADAAAGPAQAGALVDRHASWACSLLRGYLVISVLLLIVKAVQLGGA